MSRPSTVPLYPVVPPMSNKINFTPPSQPREFCQAGEVSLTMTQTFPSTFPANNLIHDRGIADLGAELDTLEKKNEFIVTKDNKSEDLKYSYNDIYIEFVKYGISLKLVT